MFRKRGKCTKFPYVTRGEALSLTKYKTGNEIFGKPYKCSFCGFWHLGHKAPKKSKVNIWRKKHKRSVTKLCKLIDEICGVSCNM